LTATTISSQHKLRRLRDPCPRSRTCHHHATGYSSIHMALYSLLRRLDSLWHGKEKRSTIPWSFAHLSMQKHATHRGDHEYIRIRLMRHELSELRAIYYLSKRNRQILKKKIRRALSSDNVRQITVSRLSNCLNSCLSHLSWLNLRTPIGV
jgi:hypothetical protein